MTTSNRNDSPTDNSADRILVQGIHVELTPALHNAILDKLSPLLRHEERTVRMHVRLQRDQKLGNDHHYTITAQMEVPGPDVIAHADGTDAYGTIDILADKLDRLLERRHDRRKDKRNHPHAVEIPADLPKT
jgi:putative sigma-54 modulation protein